MLAGNLEPDDEVEIPHLNISYQPQQISPKFTGTVQNLSGGELQLVALCLYLGKPADVYLIDELAAYLDSEQRLHAARVIKRFILHCKKVGFVVEHNFIMATYLADRVIVFDGKSSVKTHAFEP
ncbi:unnamed protein product [Rotaria sp. Silwood2]|nr:unnamed protein product [Rotaria sp. Silwood2]CAF4334338.1 unnamed protein product [Rotaria sp. Silwood2]